MSPYRHKISKLKNPGTLGIDQRLAPLFFQRFNTNEPLPKKVHELLITYIFNQFVNKEQRESAIIGFPAKYGWENECSNGELNLDYLLDHPDKFLIDFDVDTHISTDNLVIKCQVTRFVYPGVHNTQRSLPQLIKKKCRHQQPDKNLILLVSIEKSPNLTEDDFRVNLDKLRVPFSAIFLIKKASNQSGNFRLIQLYPEIRILKQIYTELPV